MDCPLEQKYAFYDSNGSHLKLRHLRPPSLVMDILVRSSG